MKKARRAVEPEEREKTAKSLLRETLNKSSFRTSEPQASAIRNPESRQDSYLLDSRFRGNDGLFVTDVLDRGFLGKVLIKAVRGELVEPRTIHVSIRPASYHLPFDRACPELVEACPEQSRRGLRANGGFNQRVLKSVASVFSCFMLLLLFASPSLAHEVRPAYLELRQTDLETYDVLWKVPGRGEDLRLGLYVELPAGCTNVTAPRMSFANNAFTERWSVKCAGGLTGSTIRIAGLTATMTDVLVRLEHLDGTTQVTRLTPDNPSFVVEAAPRALEVACTYLMLGVEHILLGIDHLLFVLALLMLVKGWRRLLGTITAFTVAHSITLALATLGFVHVPSAPVEAVIALSIMFVAAEIVHTRAGREGVTARAPWIVAFTFGLLHGFGFAGALSEVGLPAGHIPLALLFFNIGVEVGQLLFITAVLTLAVLVRRLRTPLPRQAEFVPPYIIGSVAMFWVMQRVAAF